MPSNSPGRVRVRGPWAAKQTVGLEQGLSHSCWSKQGSLALGFPQGQLLCKGPGFIHHRGQGVGGAISGILSLQIYPSWQGATSFLHGSPGALGLHATGRSHLLRDPHSFLLHRSGAGASERDLCLCPQLQVCDYQQRTGPSSSCSQLPIPRGGQERLCCRGAGLRAPTKPALLLSCPYLFTLISSQSSRFLLFSPQGPCPSSLETDLIWDCYKNNNNPNAEKPWKGLRAALPPPTLLPPHSKPSTKPHPKQTFCTGVGAGEQAGGVALGLLCTSPSWLWPQKSPRGPWRGAGSGWAP